MRFNSLFILIGLTSGFALKTWATPQDLIKSQAGCYNVAWDFTEDQVFIPNYPTTSKPYHETGMEWVTVDHDDAGRISLQHILIVDGMIQKHWRQEWLFEQPSHYDYFGNQLWKSSQAPSVQGTWQRRVYQVDDSPRQECFGVWDENQKSYTCRSWAPIPRREAMKRHDYNVLSRANTHQITASGWILKEDNTKLKVDLTGQVTKVAHETGSNVYTHANESQCQAAKDWWAANQFAWENVQDAWSEVRTTHPVLQFVTPQGQGPLWQGLFDLADGAVQAKTEHSAQFAQDIRTLINSYLK
jgi:hypothetical protein